MNELCRETLEKAYLILDGEAISSDERRKVEDHLKACEPCYERHGLDGEVKKLIARMHGAAPCPDSLKTKIAALLEDA
jgi:mycothiol system anti-sigma-R factor